MESDEGWAKHIMSNALDRTKKPVSSAVDRPTKIVPNPSNITINWYDQIHERLYGETSERLYVIRSSITL